MHQLNPDLGSSLMNHIWQRTNVLNELGHASWLAPGFIRCEEINKYPRGKNGSGSAASTLHIVGPRSLAKKAPTVPHGREDNPVFERHTTDGYWLEESHQYLSNHRWAKHRAAAVEEQRNASR
jgi:hypothetical protein